MKSKIMLCMLALSLLLASFLFVSCSKEESTPESETLKREMDIEDNDFENPAYENEGEGAELVPLKHDKEDFVGTWNAPSDRAAYLYGNVNLKIKDNGTWTGNITDESFRGKWRYNGTGISLKDSERIINWELFYEADGTLMLKDLDEPNDPLVLMPGPGSKAQ